MSIFKTREGHVGLYMAALPILPHIDEGLLLIARCVYSQKLNIETLDADGENCEIPFSSQNTIWMQELHETAVEATDAHINITVAKGLSIASLMLETGETSDVSIIVDVTEDDFQGSHSTEVDDEALQLILQHLKSTKVEADTELELQTIHDGILRDMMLQKSFDSDLENLPADMSSLRESLTEECEAIIDLHVSEDEIVHTATLCTIGRCPETGRALREFHASKRIKKDVYTRLTH